MTETEIKIKEFHIKYEITLGVWVRLQRIEDARVFKGFKLIPISNSAFFDYSAHLSKNPLKLPKLHAALTYLTGDSDDCYDEYKGSFSFMFELNVEKSSITSKYLLHIYHYRSYIEFLLYQAVPKDDPRDPEHLCSTDEKLFSEKEISTTCLGFCNGMIREMEAENYVPDSFVKSSNSNLTLFGYLNGEYFYKNFGEEEEYRTKKAQYFEALKQL